MSDGINPIGMLQGKVNASNALLVALDGGLTAAGGTVTADTPLLDLSQTWNNAGVTFRVIKVNVTDTASTAGSMFADFQRAGSSVIKLDTRGGILFPYVSPAFLAAPSGAYIALGDASGELNTSTLQIGGDLRLRAADAVAWRTSNTFDVTATDVTLGRQAAGRLVLNTATATPAGGSASMALVFGSTSGFGIYIGSGAPSVSAAQGSLYLRSDGSSATTRAYINTNGATTWTNIATAA